MYDFVVGFEMFSHLSIDDFPIIKNIAKTMKNHENSRKFVICHGWGVGLVRPGTEASRSSERVAGGGR